MVPNLTEGIPLKTPRPFDLLAIWLIAAPLALVGCPSHPEVKEGAGTETIEERGAKPQARAFEILRADDLLRGKAAEGRAGDVRLENEDVVVVIGQIGTSIAFAGSGGNLIDAARRSNPVDAISEIFTFFDNTYPRQALYTKLEVVEPGGPGKRAVVEVRGLDSDDGAIEVVTRYILAPEGAALTLETELHNTGDRGYLAFELGDVVLWGHTRLFGPGHGFDLAGTRPTVDWLAGEGAETSYGWVGADGPLATINFNGWSDATVKTAVLGPGAHASYTRYLVVGDGSIGSLMPQVLALSHAKGAKVTGTLGEKGAGAGVAGEIDVTRQGDTGGPYAIFATDQAGRFGGALSAGKYLAQGRAKGRAPDKATAFEVAPGQTASLALKVSGRGQLKFSLTAAGRPCPGKIIVLGRDGTPTPIFGLDNVAAGALNRVYTATGTGATDIPPGKYRLLASRGPEFDRPAREIEVKGGEVVSAAFELSRVVDTTGWLAGDFHEHAANSGDSSTALEDRVISNLGEGVEILVSTDHNYVTDFGPVVAKLGVGQWIATVVGDEVTTSDLGHFNAYPLRLDPAAPNGGAMAPEGLTPAEIFAGMAAAKPTYKVIQVNHPRSHSGYLAAMRFDPTTFTSPDKRMSWNFDAIEVYNGKRPETTMAAMKDWFAMLDHGGLYTAMGNSDTHVIAGQEPGLARSLVYLGIDDPAKLDERALVAAIRDKHAVVVTNGPFIDFGLGDVPVGGFVAPIKGATAQAKIRVQAPRWISVDRVELLWMGKVIKTWSGLGVVEDVVRLEASESVPIGTPGYYLVRVFGDTPMEHVGRKPHRPLAFTNPIWVGVRER